MKKLLPYFFKEITPDYIEDIKGNLESFETLIKVQDFKKIKEEFHKLAGSGTSYGLNEVSDIAHQIEARAINKECSQDLFSDFKVFINSVDITYRGD